MGLIWDLIQHGQIREGQQRTGSLEDRVSRLEDEVSRTNEMVVRLLQALEKRFGEDLDGDGRVG
jgi:predicted nuclease with TOPRIM domain